MQHLVAVPVTLVSRRLGLRHRIPCQRKVGREPAGAQVRAVATPPSGRTSVEHGEMLGLGTASTGGTGQIEVCLDDLGNMAQQGRGSLLPVVLDEGAEARGRAAHHGLTDVVRCNLAAEHVAAQVLEADGLLGVDAIDFPADGGLTVNLLQDSTWGRWCHRVVGHPLDLHFRPREAGLLAPDVQLEAIGYGGAPCGVQGPNGSVTCLPSTPEPGHDTF